MDVEVAKLKETCKSIVSPSLLCSVSLLQLCQTSNMPSNPMTMIL